MICIKDITDKILGLLVNFACHPNYQIDESAFSADFPGILAREIKKMFNDECVCLFLNGAAGNITSGSQLNPEYIVNPEKRGKTLANDVFEITKELFFQDQITLGSKTTTLKLPIRDIPEKSIKGTRLSERFASDEVYENSIRILQEKKKVKNFQYAQGRFLWSLSISPRRKESSLVERMYFLFNFSSSLF